jgi:hypothetical protein
VLVYKLDRLGRTQLGILDASELRSVTSHSS